MTMNSTLVDPSMNFSVQVTGKSLTDEHYFVVSPFVLDCSADADAFLAKVMPEHRRAMLEKLASGEQILVGHIRGTAREYANAKLKAAYRRLTKKEAAEVQRTLSDWQTERGRLPTQLSKPLNRRFESGVEIIFPFNEIRLPYGLESIMLAH